MRALGIWCSKPNEYVVGRQTFSGTTGAKLGQSSMDSINAVIAKAEAEHYRLKSMGGVSKYTTFDRDSSVDQTFRVTFDSTKQNLNAASVKLAYATCAYTGSARTPAVTVTVAGKKLVEGTDYVVSYSANVNPGTATATVTGIGQWQGSCGTVKVDTLACR